MASSSTRPKSPYDVFLSFRGEDTGKNFTDHLYQALERCGIYTFKDDQKLKRGETVAPELLKALEGSACSITVLSKNFIRSPRCLDELEMIVECNKSDGQRFYPVFYDVSPDELRLEAGKFKKAFDQTFSQEKIQRWKDALLRAADSPGWSVGDRDEATVIKEMTNEITQFLSTRTHSPPSSSPSPPRPRPPPSLLQARLPPPKPPPTSLPSTQSLIYDVFLNAKSADIRETFLIRLFQGLKLNSITFSCDEVIFWQKIAFNYFLAELMAPDSLRASIGSSPCSVVILSKNYAASTRYLDELVMILQSHHHFGQKVYAIYYDVDTHEVRKQRGHFEQAFAKHEKIIKEPGRIQSWRDALREISEFPAWSLGGGRDEEPVVKEIVHEITKFLKSRIRLITNDNLIGIEKHLKVLEDKMCLGSKDVRFIGIWGKGGIGKTTLARRIYDSKSPQFEHTSFLANVAEQSEKGNLVLLQKQLLSENLVNEAVTNPWNVYDGADIIRLRLCNKRSLVVIDGVDDEDQLSFLAKNPDWFGPGSRIIITSKDKYLLKGCGVEEKYIYQLPALNPDEALQLISLKAFNRNTIPKDLEELCKCIAEHTCGLPWALEVFSSVLQGRPANECILLMRHIKEMGHRIVEDQSSSKPGKSRRFWRDELSQMLIPGTECVIDINTAHNDWTRKIDMEWICTIANFGMELTSAVLDQVASQPKPHFALIAMFMSFAGTIASVVEIIYKARKEKIRWKKPWFYYPSPRDNIRFGSFADIVGLVCAICQSIVLTINYSFLVRHSSSPIIKISVWPMIFSFFVVFSKVLEARDKVVRPRGNTGNDLHPKTT